MRQVPVHTAAERGRSAGLPAQAWLHHAMTAAQHDTHARTQEQTHARAHTQHGRTHTHTHDTRTHAHTHARTHARTLTHSHTHTHTLESKGGWCVVQRGLRRSGR
jgi:hypothetical protein